MMIFRRILRVLELIFYSHEEYLRKEGVKIGKNCWISSRNFGSEPYLVEIGDHVQITRDVKIFTHGGVWVLAEEFPDIDSFGKVKIGNNVYI